MVNYSLRLRVAAEPPPPILLPDLTLSSYTFSNGLPENSKIADISGNDLGALLSIAAGDDRLKINGDGTQLLVGGTQATAGTFSAGIVSTLAEADNSPHTTPISLTVTSASLTPMLNDIALPMGIYTPPGMGTVLLKNIPGLVDPLSPQIVSWRMGSVTAGSGGLATDLGSLLTTNTAFATARTPRTTRGTISEVTTNRLPGADYTIPLIAVGEDGSEATCTITIQPVAGALSRGDDYVSPANDGATAIQQRLAAKMSGLKMLISVGHGPDQSFSLANLIQAGRVAVEYADPARPSKLRTVDVYNCHRIDFNELGVGGTPAHRFHFRAGSSDCWAYDCFTIDGSEADLDLVVGAQNHYAFYFRGVTNCGALGGSFNHIGRCVSYGGGGSATHPDRSFDCVIEGVLFDHYYGDAIQEGGGEGNQFLGNGVFAPMRGFNPSTGIPSVDHIDQTQFAPFNPQQVLIKGNVFGHADGNAGSIGIINSATTASGPATESKLSGVDYGGNILAIRAGTAMNWGSVDGLDLHDCTIVCVTSGLIGSPNIVVDKGVSGLETVNDNVTADAQQIILYPSTPLPSTIQRVFTMGSIGSAAGITKTDCRELNIALTAMKQMQPEDGVNSLPEWLPTGVRTYDFTNWFKYPDVIERLGNYHPIDNPNGAAFANMTPAEKKALYIDVLTPKVTPGQTIYNDLHGDGTVSIGAVNFDETMKTA